MESGRSDIEMIIPVWLKIFDSIIILIYSLSFAQLNKNIFIKILDRAEHLRFKVECLLWPVSGSWCKREFLIGCLRDVAAYAQLHL